MVDGLIKDILVPHYLYTMNEYTWITQRVLFRFSVNLIHLVIELFIR